MLFWAILFSPAWILVFKLHGLYDNDHRRIRHSTLDELPALISASALGTLALDGLLALSPVGPLSAASAIIVGVGAAGRRASSLRGGAALPLAPADRGRDRPDDRPGGGGRPRRQAALDPPRDPPAPGRLPRPGRRRGRRRSCRGSGSIADISRVAGEYDVERVVVTEQGMSEQAAEALIEECKAAGLGADLPAAPLRAARARGSSSTASPSCRCSTSASPTRRARRWR